MKKILCEVNPLTTIVDLIPHTTIDEKVTLKLDRPEILYAMKKSDVFYVDNGNRIHIDNVSTLDTILKDGENNKRTIDVKVNKVDKSVNVVSKKSKYAPKTEGFKSNNESAQSIKDIPTETETVSETSAGLNRSKK